MGESITLDVNFYIAIAFAITFYALLIWLSVHAVRKNKIVKKKSLKIKKIKELNKEYYFIALPTLITKTCDSLAEYGKANFDSILKNAILSNTGYYREKLEAGERDFEKYKNYISSFREIMDANSIEEETLYKKYKYFKKKETKLCESIKKPVIETYYLEVKKEYTSPAQRNHYEDSKRYSINELKKYIKPNNIESEESDLELFQ